MFSRLHRCIGALASSPGYNFTTDNRPASEHQHADRPTRGDTNDDASNFSGPSGATAVAKVENKDAPGRVRCSLLRRIFNKGKIKGRSPVTLQPRGTASTILGGRPLSTE